MYYADLWFKINYSSQ